MMPKAHCSRIVLTVLVMPLVLYALASVGCQKPTERLNAPPQGHTEHPHDLQSTYVHMTDNAMLEDMSMSAVHFVPHTPDLNALGVRRMKRYASILKVYGGTLRYDGTESGKDLASARLKEMKGFLVAEGVEAERFEVATGLAGGPGMNAQEAIAVRQASTFKCGKGKQDKDSGDLTSMEGMASPGSGKSQ